MARKPTSKPAKPKAAASQAPAPQDNQPPAGVQAAADDGQQPQAGANDAPAVQNATQPTAVKDGAAQPGATPQTEAAFNAVVDFDAVAVVGPKKGRWRIRRHFTPEVTIIPLTELSVNDLKALKGDPCLVIGHARLGDTTD